MWLGTGRRCVSLTSSKAYCARDDAVEEARLELAFSRYEVYEENKRGIPPQGAISIHHSGERIRKTTLTVFPPLYLILITGASVPTAIT